MDRFKVGVKLFASVVVTSLITVLIGFIGYRALLETSAAVTERQAVGTAKKGVGNLLKVKGGSKTKVLSRQEQQKAKEELELKKFTDFVVSTFEGVKTSVDRRLEKLEETVNSLFDAGTDAAICALMVWYCSVRSLPSGRPRARAILENTCGSW